MTVVTRRLAGFVACCLLVGYCQAAENGRVAITKLSDVDADFKLQGEYFGAVSPDAFGAENMGLQVVALGEGNFDGRLLHGGLPGAGWDRQTVTRLAGDTVDGTGQLVGSIYQVAVTPREAVVRSDAGMELARLPKIKRISLTQGLQPPANAIVLFGGSSTDQLVNGKVTADGLLDVGAMTKLKVADFRMHLEFRTPYMPKSRGQGRGNSGIYIQQRYEVQVLDSFGLEGVENECGALYKQRRPDVNMCLPPLSWQTYDIYFTAARFDSQGNKQRSARITAWHNGELIHNNYKIKTKTGAGQKEGPQPRPILFQNHGNPVRYRNIWIVPANQQVVYHRHDAVLLPGTIHAHSPACFVYPCDCVCY